MTVFCNLTVLRDFQRLAKCRGRKAVARDARRWNHGSSTANWASGVGRGPGVGVGVGCRWLHQSDGVRAERFQGGARTISPLPPRWPALDRRLRRPSPQHVAGPCPMVARLQRSRGRTAWWTAPSGRTSLCGRRAIACWRPGLQLAIARGELFPQTQTAERRLRAGGSRPRRSSAACGSRFADQWNFGLQPRLGA